MQKKMFLLLSGLLLLISFPAAQTFGMTPLPDVTGTWSAPIYHPEIGDKIVSVNNQRVHSEAEFRRAVRNSSSEIILGVIDQRTGNFYHLRTRLWSSYNQTRLGIYIETAGNHNGVIVTGFVPDSPGMHCQYMRGEITPPHDVWYGDGGWFYDVDVYYDEDGYWYEY